ncbi:MAG: hypothetical protein IT304_02230 [Dehalococcoidia bacterium]|nr:hypothetical protein [Dehalococcoidia bacterium]
MLLRVWHAAPGRWLAASMAVFALVAVSGSVVGLRTQHEVGRATREASATSQAVAAVQSALDDLKEDLRDGANGDAAAARSARESARRLQQAVQGLASAPLGLGGRQAAERLASEIVAWRGTAGAGAFTDLPGWDLAAAALRTEAVADALVGLVAATNAHSQAALSTAMATYRLGNRFLASGGTAGIALALGVGYVGVRRIRLDATGEPLRADQPGEQEELTAAAG